MTEKGFSSEGKGSILVPDELQQGELAAFASSSAVLEFEAQSDGEFVLGSAVSQKYDLVLGSHSMHTSAKAVREAETRISDIQARLIQQERLCTNVIPQRQALARQDLHPALSDPAENGRMARTGHRRNICVLEGSR